MTRLAVGDNRLLRHRRQSPRRPVAVTTRDNHVLRACQASKSAAAFSRHNICRQIRRRLRPFPLIEWSVAALSRPRKPLCGSLRRSRYPSAAAATLPERRCARHRPDHGGVLAVWLLVVLHFVVAECPAVLRPACQPGRFDLFAHLGRHFRPDGRVVGPTDPPGPPRSRSPWLPRDNVIAAAACPS